jgi:hypothetical protein
MKMSSMFDLGCFGRPDCDNFRRKQVTFGRIRYHFSGIKKPSNLVMSFSFRSRMIQTARA